jgi:outer membrane lipoprotein-sorting protein
MQAKEMFLKQINRKLLIHVLFLGALTCSQVLAKDSVLTKDSLNDYIKKSNKFSAQFIQVSNESLSDGFLYLDKKRIKIEYINPSKITLILTESKAMYFNHDLDEVEYFNPTKTIGNIFYQIFYNNDFFKKTELIIQTNSITAVKDFRVDDEDVILNIYFEQNPLILRKVEIKKNSESIIFSISNINHNPNFNKNFFSMVDPRSN